LSFQSSARRGSFSAFAEQDVQRQVDRLIVKVAVAQAQMLSFQSSARRGSFSAFAEQDVQRQVDRLIVKVAV
ncbi:hypothetical protein C9885_29840, partial [Klebsiella pneumoniae]